MKNYTNKLLFVVISFLTLTFSSCSEEKSVKIPMVGDTVAEVEQKFIDEKDNIEKDDYPGIWVLDDYNILVEFENGRVKHVVAAGECDRVRDVLAHMGHRLPIDGDYKLMHSENQDVYYINKTLTAYCIAMPKEEGAIIQHALDMGSNEYNSPESIVKNEDAVDDISYSIWHYIIKVFGFISQAF